MFPDVEREEWVNCLGSPTSMLDGAGQAGVAEVEIEVTSAMVRAGVYALDLWRGAAESFDLVERMYSAMALAPVRPMRVSSPVE